MAKKIQKLYQDLLDLLARGEAAAIVSRYYDNNITIKELVSSLELNRWAELERLENQSAAVTCGSVTSIKGESDCCLTIIERYAAQSRMVILGAGHIAVQLAPIAKRAEFEVLVYDDRASFANAKNFPDADVVICDSFTHLFQRVQLHNTDYVVVVTRGHKHDVSCLQGILAGSKPAYTGMIGSKRRVAIVKQQLSAEGYDAQRIEQIHAPIGLKIGAITPFEIAISIIAEIIKVKRLDLNKGSLVSSDLNAVKTLAQDSSQFDAVATVYKTEGSVPVNSGAKLAMGYAGELAGTIGGGCSEAEVMQAARELINRGACKNSDSDASYCSNGWRSQLVDMSNSAEGSGMVCGGMMQVVIENIS